VVSFTPRPLYLRGKSSWYPLDRRLDGPQNRSGRGIPLPLPGLKPRFPVLIHFSNGAGEAARKPLKVLVTCALMSDIPTRYFRDILCFAVGSTRRFFLPSQCIRCLSFIFSPSAAGGPHFWESLRSETDAKMVALSVLIFGRGESDSHVTSCYFCCTIHKQHQPQGNMLNVTLNHTVSVFYVMCTRTVREIYNVFFQLVNIAWF